MQLKICGLKDPGNISKIIALNPDYIGFILYRKSNRYIPSWILRNVIPKIPKRIKKVGVFVNEELRVVEAMYNIYSLDFIQLHGTEDSEYCTELSNRNIPIIKAFSIDEFFDFNRLDEYTHSCSYFLFDTKGKFQGGNGTKFNWELLNDYKYKIPFFLSGGIDLVDVETINQISLDRLYAIDINSKFETEVGIKDISKLQKFKKELINKSKMQYENQNR